MIEQRDIIVWVISATLAVGLGASRYAKWKSRHDLVRQIAAMETEARKKMLSRLQPAVAMEVRRELLERFRILLKRPQVSGPVLRRSAGVRGSCSGSRVGSKQRRSGVGRGRGS